MLNLHAVDLSVLHSAGHDHSSGDGATGADEGATALPSRRVKASRARDLLTGDPAVSTTFRFGPRSSLFSRYDTITNFNNTDAVDAPGVRGTQLGLSEDACTEISALSAKAIATECCTKEVFAAGDVCLFTVAGINGTFLVLNDAQAGFQANLDSVVFLSGYNLSDTNSIRLV